MPVELTQTQKRSLYDCLREHEGEEEISLPLIASEIGLPISETRELLAATGVECGFCVARKVGGKWRTIFSPEFWD